nr:hypothetical protein [Candidatus Ichthyocystis sparus]
MNPVTGVSVAGPSGDDDQADSGDLQQVQVLPGGVLDVVTTATAVSTIVATSTVATTSVGKGSSGGRSDKGKGPAPKRCAAGSVVSATSVNPTHASTNPELSAPTSSVTTAACTRAADFDIILDSVIEAARTRRAAADAADSRASAAAAAAARVHNRADTIPNTYPNPTLARASACSMDSCARSVAVHAADAAAAAAAADRVVALARAIAAGLVAAQDRAADSRVSIVCPDFWIIIDSVVASARSYHAVADAADASANSAAVAAARATDAFFNFDAAARAGASISDTDSAALARSARAHASARTRLCARAADSKDRAVAARAAAVAADRVVALARAFAADHIVAQDRAADSRVPSIGTDSDPISDSGACSSFMPPGFVDLLGFVVSIEFSEMVNKLISEVCALAENIISHYITRAVSDILRNLSSSERSAWCLINGKLYELKFVAKCFVEYSSQLLSTFINNLCGVRVWDSSSRSLVLLTGNRLADFWLSLDEAILKAIAGFFMPKWYELIGRSSASSGTVEGLSDLCGGDFVSACARAGTSSSSVSIFDSASEGMRARVASHDGDSLASVDFVDLFGFEAPPVEEMVNVLICEVSVLARRTYSSVVAVPVSSALRELSFSEQCAWLITNMMLYKTSFVYNFFLEYCGGLCSEFICSLFRVIPEDASGRSLLSLTGDSLRGFWMSLSETVMKIVQDIFKAEWEVLISQFSVLLSPGEESSSSVLCVRDFIDARDKAGMHALTASRTSSSVVVEVEESSTTIPTMGSPALRIGSSGGPVAPKKLFISMYRSGVASSSGMSSSSTSSGSIVSSGPLSSVPAVTTGSVSPLAITTGIAPGEGDIGERLAALMNRGLPPSPPPASESAPTGGEASSSTRGSGRGRRKRKRRS